MCRFDGFGRLGDDKKGHFWVLAALDKVLVKAQSILPRSTVMLS
jgi:hypothetical protein